MRAYVRRKLIGHHQHPDLLVIIIIISIDVFCECCSTKALELHDDDTHLTTVRVNHQLTRISSLNLDLLSPVCCLCVMISVVIYKIKIIITERDRERETLIDQVAWMDR